MIKKFLLMIIICSVAVAVQANELRVEDHTITAAIENRMPVDSIDSYPADYGKLYSFSRITGAREETYITHVWFYEHQEMARVSLPVRSSDWRTYSSKRFLPQWVGEWSVVIEDAQGRPLSEVSFRLE